MTECTSVDDHHRARWRAHYVDALIGTPWRRDGFHCWQLVRKVEADLFGRDLPVVLEVSPDDDEKRELFGNHPERRNWREATVAEASLRQGIDGAVVLMERRHIGAKSSIHCGVYLDIEGGGVLHVDAPQGVAFDSLPVLRLRGWSTTFLVPRGQDAS